MGDTTREKWDTEKMREHRNDWSLAADIHLFSYMQQFSQNLLSETHSTLKVLDSLESDIATSCVEVSNIGNRFWALSDTQFIENRVYDDDEITSPAAQTSPQANETANSEAVVIQRLREAIQNGIQVLDTKFETVQIPASDSEEEDSSPHSGVILKPVNRYRARRLPHLIGSAEFQSDDTLGLCDAPSEEETDDFMSASDKANESDSVGESEDSDIESDQTKGQPAPHNLRLPDLENVQADSNVPSPTSGYMFGDDLFSQIAQKKPMFSSWQPSDLWAPEHEEEKPSFDDPSSNRPPSANSSISSAQSSNVSEPIKKTSEDFGKSGTGRQAVLVQEDQDDIFGSKASSATPPQIKEFVPAGGVKIFGGDFNPFSNRNPLKENQNEDLASNSDNKRPVMGDVEDKIFVEKPPVPEKVLPVVPPSNVFSKKKEVSLFDDEEEDDIFFNRQSEPKSKSQPPSSVASSISFGANRTEPEDDDLFSDSSLFSASKTRLSHSLFKDDLFSDEPDELFSKMDQSKQSIEKVAAVSQSPRDNLFSNRDQQDTNREIKSKVPSQKTKSQNVNTNLFGDEDDLFGNVTKSKGDNLFGGPPSVTKPSISKEQSKLQSSKSSKNDLFDDSDNDNDLFSSLSRNEKTNPNPSVQKDLSSEYKNISNKKEVVKDDLFGPTRLSNAKQQSVKGKSSLLKSKKGIEKRSLFDSDSDDDLFSSPQGSLSSRKSVQSSNAAIESSEQEDMRKSSKTSAYSRLPKTDFSSIFSNDRDETDDFKLDKETESSNFGEESDLFAGSNVKTPDLFSQLLPKSVPKEHDNIDKAPKEKNNERIKESESTIKDEVIEAINEKITDKREETPVLPVPLKTDIFSESPHEIEKKPPTSKKPEPPRSLDIKPIVDTLKNDKNELSVKKNVDVQKPLVSNKPVLVEKPITNDTTDGEVVSPLSSSKSVPGKLKASQLININTAALLPGARPSKSDPQLSGRFETKDEPELITEPLKVTPEIPPVQAQATNEVIADIPPKVSLLQSVNKERVKIQGKRRPSSRRARQEALKASSLDAGSATGAEADSESSSGPQVTSTLMSPSTDEEDLFGVPPLDTVYDIKTVSPSTDIFGTPTVLSPVTNKELPSSFVSTPFIHSQPPPLDEEQEEGSNHEEDLFGSQSNFLSSLSEKKPQKVVQEIKKSSVVDDIFSDVEDDGMFRGMKEAPPPLLDDDDDDEDYDDLFMSRKKEDKVTNKISYSGSVISSLESLPKEDPLFSNPSHNTKSAVSGAHSLPPKSQGWEDDSIFPTKDSTKLTSSSLFANLEDPEELGSDNSFFKHSVKNSTIIPEDTLFSVDTSSIKPSGSSKGVAGSVKDIKDDSLFSESSEDVISSHFTDPGKGRSSELFASIQSPSSVPADLKSKAKEENYFISDDELFRSDVKPSKVKSSISGTIGVDESKSTLKTGDFKQEKRDSLFGEDDEDVGNLFSSGNDKKAKVKSSTKSSLFGDEDDDDIFGSLATSKKTDTKTYSASESSKGGSLKAAKPGISASTKPVKLESKQTFSDPLLSHEDQE